MPKVKNRSEYTIKVPNYPAFTAGETREVSQEDVEILLRSEHFILVKEVKETSKQESNEVNTDEEVPVADDKKN